MAVPLLLLPWIAACTCDRPRIPPDLVLVLVDTLRADAPGYAGDPLPATPNLDALAADSAWFDRSFAASTWTLPSTASILTGLLPSDHRVVRDPHDPDLFGRLDPSIPTLATVLAGQGYRVAAFVNNTFLAPEFGLNRGFEPYDYQGGALVGHRSAAATVGRALEWLDSAEGPAFMLVHFMEPHADYDAPPPFAGRFTSGLPHEVELPLGDQMIADLITHDAELPERDREYVRHAYAEEVLTADGALGELLAGLRERPEWDDEILVFTADHGEEFWDHGDYEHGHSTRSVVTRVPLVIHAPGVIPGPKTTVVENRAIFELFTDPAASDLLRLARSDTDQPGRVAIQEDILYGPDQLSAVDGELRFTWHVDTQTASLQRLGEGCDEVEDISGSPDRQRLGQHLYDALVRRRGDLEPTPPLESVAIPGPRAIEQLRALGYVQ